MTLRRSRTMPTKLTDNIETEEAAIAFVDSIPTKET